MTTKLTTVLAGLTLASLPVVVDAQSTTGQQQQQTRPRTTTSQEQTRSNRATDQDSPQHHLNEAKRVLNSINRGSLQGEARTQITEIRGHFNQLESAWRTSAAASARTGAERSEHSTGHTTGTTGSTAGTTGTRPEEEERQTPRSGTASSMAGQNDWMTHYQAIDNILDQLVGANQASVSGQAGTTGTAGTTTGTTTGTVSGTAGRAGATAGVSADINLDANVRAKLTEFRRHLDAFHAAAMTAQQRGRMGEEDAASAARHSGITGAMTGTGTAGTTGTTPPSDPTEPTATPEPQDPRASSASRQTQSTAAVSGQATIDSATIARLTASIDELLRGGTSTSVSAGTTTGTTGTTTGTTTATGTAGTSGTAAATGTVCVDRVKLEQLRRDIQALQRENPRQ